MATLKQVLWAVFAVGLLGFVLLVWAEYKVNQISNSVTSRVEVLVDEVVEAPSRALSSAFETAQGAGQDFNDRINDAIEEAGYADQVNGAAQAVGDFVEWIIPF
ncbi:MAG: hypothetical protein AAFX06_24255 [Planctomycetota bacterium]